MRARKGLSAAVAMLPFVLAALGFAEAATLNLSDAVGAPGGTVEIAVSLNSEGSSVAGASSDISYDPAVFSNPRAVIDSSIAADTGATKQVIFNVVEDGLFRFGVFGLNQTAIPDGVIAWVSLDVKGDARRGSVTELGNKPGATDGQGNALTVSGPAARIYISGSGGAIEAAPSAIPPLSITISPASGIVGSPLDVTIKVSEATGIENLMDEGFSVFLNGEDMTSFLVNSGTVSIDAEKGEATLSVRGLGLPQGDYEINAYLGNLSGYIGHASAKYSVTGH